MVGLSDSALAVIAAAKEKIVDPSINPLLEDLPDRFKVLRDHQIPAIKKVIAAFEYVDVVVLDAPTGSGKTLIAEIVRRIMKARAVYVCSSKSLQDQFLRDFPYAKVVKGRGNYPTECFPQRYDPGDWGQHLSCEDCTATAGNDYSCKWCSAKWSCPYEKAKNDAIRSSLAVLNTSYFLAEANNVGRFSSAPRGDGKEVDRGLVIADEADTLESSLMGYVSVEISEKRMERYGWFPPKKTTVARSWLEWLDETIPQVQALVKQLPEPGLGDVREERERRYLLGLWESLYRIRVDLAGEESTWVYTGKGNDGGGRNVKNVGREVSFKPSHGSGFAENMLWKHGKKWLLMSASFVSPQFVVEKELGWNGAYEVVRVPMTFNKRNRQVKVVANVDMTRANKASAWPKVGKDVAAIVARHPGERVLVHSVSYDLTRSIVDNLAATNRPIVSYSGPNYREGALAKFLRGNSSVLVAPSMDRGIDLPGDACRVQVLVKCPFPYIGDKQVSARMHSKDGGTWYALQTIRSIMQMCGRAVRNEDDWAVTYILDEQFKTNLWARHRGLFPQWFVEGLVW